MSEVKEAPASKTEVTRGRGPSAEVERRPSMSALGQAHPIAVMNRLTEQMDRLLEDFGVHLPSFFGRGRELLRREAGLIPGAWSPRLEIKDADGRFVVRAELPGLSKQDIDVQVTDDMLTIRGERNQEKEERREGFHYNECSYGSFYRTIPLPEGADASKATAEYCNGMLEISMPSPRRAQPQPRQIVVHEKK
jgi:HSP20 family protein